MPLLPVSLPLATSSPPPDVRRFLRAAERRIERFQQAGRFPAFVASDFTYTYAALRAVEDADLLPGRWFCEWGSGFGVVACLAAMLGFDAWGIEVEEELVDAGRRLAADFGLAVEFVHGSFIPQAAQDRVTAGRAFTWLSTPAASAYEEMGFDPDDFDLIFAYPWPDEEELTADLFGRYARPGALLLTYHGGEDLCLHRKVGRRTRGQ